MNSIEQLQINDASHGFEFENLTNTNSFLSCFKLSALALEGRKTKVHTTEVVVCSLLSYAIYLHKIGWIE
jgi:hypothetical protein